MRVCILSGIGYGTNYYRATLVKRAIDRWGGPLGVEAFHTHLFSLSFMDPKAVDVFYLLRPIPEMIPVEMLHRLKREGRPIVLDYDDDLFAVPSWSPSSLTFDLGGIREFCRGVHACPDVITTTTAAGARIVKEYTPDAETRVIPNAFDPALKILRPFPKWKDGDVPNIGWAGGSQHERDLAHLLPVFHECLQRGYGLTFIGDGPRGLRGLPGKKIAWVQGTHEIEEFHQALALVGFNVGLAPVVDERFNHSKSALKPAEYGWYAGCPSVISDLSCYDEVEDDGQWNHKVRGWDRDLWMDRIEKALAVTREHGRRYRTPDRYNIKTTFHQWCAAFNRAHQIARGEDAPGYREAEAPAEARVLETSPN